MLKSSALTLAALMFAAPIAAHAEGAKDAIEARRGYYDLVKVNFGPIVDMAKGQVDYSAEAAAVFTGNLKALGSMNLAPMYPAGSDNDAMFGDTRALPAIWSKPAEFSAKVKAFTDAVNALDAAAAQDLNALRGAVGAVGASCKGCHDDFRAESF